MEERGGRYAAVLFWRRFCQGFRMNSKRKGPFVVGIDFGTLSARALLVEAGNGTEVATAVHEYEHGVIEETLPGDAKRLAPDTALQDPADYLAAMRAVVPRVL